MPPAAVRAVYIVPKDAQPWSEARVRVTQAVEDIQRFISHEMTRTGQGERTFRIAREPDGLIHFRTLHATSYLKAQFQQGRATALHLCGRVAGPPDLTYAEIFLVEAYSIRNGEVTGDIAGYSKRRACVSSLHLKVAFREWLHRDDDFFGQIFPWISPEPILKWKHREGFQLGDVAGAGFGTIAHELIHCFGPDNHNGKKDNETKYEDVMGTGFRRMRKFLQGGDTVGSCVLSQRAAEIMSKNLPDAD